MIDNDIFNLILKYLIKCYKCNKYYQKIYIDYCDKCYWNSFTTTKIYFCKECSKSCLHNDVDHRFWVCLCKKCLDEEIHGCVWV
jgi:hypothetical protein